MSLITKSLSKSLKHNCDYEQKAKKSLIESSDSDYFCEEEEEEESFSKLNNNNKSSKNGKGKIKSKSKSKTKSNKLSFARNGNSKHSLGVIGENNYKEEDSNGTFQDNFNDEKESALQYNLVNSNKIHNSSSIDGIISRNKDFASSKRCSFLSPYANDSTHLSNRQTTVSQISDIKFPDSKNSFNDCNKAELELIALSKFSKSNCQVKEDESIINKGNQDEESSSVITRTNKSKKLLNHNVKRKLNKDFDFLSKSKTKSVGNKKQSKKIIEDSEENNNNNNDDDNAVDAEYGYLRRIAEFNLLAGCNDIYLREKERFVIEEFLNDQKKKIIYLSGQPGTGKTSLIMNILSQRASKICNLTREGLNWNDSELADFQSIAYDFIVNINCLSIRSINDIYSRVLEEADNLKPILCEVFNHPNKDSTSNHKPGNKTSTNESNESKEKKQVSGSLDNNETYSNNQLNTKSKSSSHNKTFKNTCNNVNVYDETDLSKLNNPTLQNFINLIACYNNDDKQLNTVKLRNYFSQLIHVFGNRINLIIILDEIDGIYQETSQNSITAKNQLNFKEFVKSPYIIGGLIKIIMICNNTEFDKKITDCLQSADSKSMTKVIFEPYSDKEMLEILTNILKNNNNLQKIEESALRFLAKKAAAVSGDIRKGLNYIQNIFLSFFDSKNNKESKEANSKINMNHMVQYFKIKDSHFLEFMRSLTSEQKLVILSIYLVLKENPDKTDLSETEVLYQYKKIKSTKFKCSVVNMNDYHEIVYSLKDSGVIEIRKNPKGKSIFKVKKTIEELELIYSDDFVFKMMNTDLSEIIN